ncbi:hypothetical protein AB4Z45_25785 [Paenibacillus sp. MCAF9]
MYENLNPLDVERIAVETLDQTKKIPLLQSELTNLLASQTFSEEDIQLACSLQEQFRLIQKLNKTKGKEPIYSNEYVWGPKHENIVMTVSSLARLLMQQGLHVKSFYHRSKILLTHVIERRALSLLHLLKL